jgi:hypothetical protein
MRYNRFNRWRKAGFWDRPMGLRGCDTQCNNSWGPSVDFAVEMDEYYIAHDVPVADIRLEILR